MAKGIYRQLEERMRILGIETPQNYIANVINGATDQTSVAA